MKKNKENLLEITQIKIVLPGKTIELSSEEARKVYKELQTLFAAERTDFEKLKEEWEKLVSQTPMPYHPPIVIERWIEPNKPYWEWNQPYCSPNNPDFGHTTTCLSINLTDNTNLPNGGTITDGGLT